MKNRVRLGARGVVVVKALRYKSDGRGFIPDGVTDIILPVALWSWGDSASNRNEYQVYFLGSKSGRCVRLATLPPSCTVVMNSGNLNFLEPSGPLQACNGTALTF